MDCSSFGSLFAGSSLRESEALFGPMFVVDGKSRGKSRSRAANHPG